MPRIATSPQKTTRNEEISIRKNRVLDHGTQNGKKRALSPPRVPPRSFSIASLISPNAANRILQTPRSRCSLLPSIRSGSMRVSADLHQASAMPRGVFARDRPNRNTFPTCRRRARSSRVDAVQARAAALLQLRQPGLMVASAVGTLSIGRASNAAFSACPHGLCGRRRSSRHCSLFKVFGSWLGAIDAPEFDLRTHSCLCFELTSKTLRALGLFACCVSRNTFCGSYLASMEAEHGAESVVRPLRYGSYTLQRVPLPIPLFGLETRCPSSLDLLWPESRRKYHLAASGRLRKGCRMSCSRV